MTTTAELGSQIVQNTLAHYGVKGMKWGVRRDRGERGATPVTTKERPGRRVQAKGGQRTPPHEDAVSSARNRQIAKRSTTDALSTKDLQALVNRMNLEDQYDRLVASDKRMSVGRMMAKNLLKEVDAELVTETASGVATAIGKPLSDSAQAKIHAGTTIARIAFGMKSGGGKKKNK